jgi:hypothetical protein
MARLPANQKERDSIIERRKQQAHRLEQYVHDRGRGSVHNLLNSMGKNTYYDMYRKMLTGNRNFTPKFLEDLKKKEPEINLTWLLNGTGSMVIRYSDKPLDAANANEPMVEAINQYIATDNSMSPNIMKGDVLVYEDLLPNQSPVFGELFVVKTSTMIAARIVWSQDDKYILSPYDKARTPDIILSKSEVKSIHPVKKIIRIL